MYINQTHSAVKVERDQFSKDHIALLRQHRAHEFLGKRALGTKVLSAQFVLLFASDRCVDSH